MDAGAGRAAPAGAVVLGSVRKVPALGDAALKSLSECSFTARKLRFFERFRGAAIGIA
jgi:hypothetical protein